MSNINLMKCPRRLITKFLTQKGKKTEKLQAKNNDFIVPEMFGQCWESLCISVYFKMQ